MRTYASIAITQTNIFSPNPEYIIRKTKCGLLFCNAFRKRINEVAVAIKRMKLPTHRTKISKPIFVNGFLNRIAIALPKININKTGSSVLNKFLFCITRKDKTKTINQSQLMERGYLMMVMI